MGQDGIRIMNELQKDMLNLEDTTNLITTTRHHQYNARRLFKLLKTTRQDR